MASHHMRQSLECIVCEIAARAELLETKMLVLLPALQLTDPIECLSLARYTTRAEKCNNGCAARYHAAVGVNSNERMASPPYCVASTDWVVPCLVVSRTSRPCRARRAGA